jgi:hypothetical protein
MAQPDESALKRWRDRRKESAEKPINITPQSLNKTVDALSKVMGGKQQLTGQVQRTAGPGNTMRVALDQSHQGLKEIPAIAVQGCDSHGKVSLMKGEDGQWYGFGSGQTETVSRQRDLARSDTPPDETTATGEVAYLYSIRDGNTRSLYVAGWTPNTKVKVCDLNTQTYSQPIAYLNWRGSSDWSVDLYYSKTVNLVAVHKIARYVSTGGPPSLAWEVDRPSGFTLTAAFTGSGFSNSVRLLQRNPIGIGWKGHGHWLMADTSNWLNYLPYAYFAKEYNSSSNVFNVWVLPTLPSIMPYRPSVSNQQIRIGLMQPENGAFQASPQPMPQVQSSYACTLVLPLNGSANAVGYDCNYVSGSGGSAIDLALYRIPYRIGQGGERSICVSSTHQHTEIVAMGAAQSLDQSASWTVEWTDGNAISPISKASVETTENYAQNSYVATGNVSEQIPGLPGSYEAFPENVITYDLLVDPKSISVTDAFGDHGGIVDVFEDSFTVLDPWFVTSRFLEFSRVREMGGIIPSTINSPQGYNPSIGISFNLPQVFIEQGASTAIDIEIRHYKNDGTELKQIAATVYGIPEDPATMTMATSYNDFELHYLSCSIEI